MYKIKNKVFLSELGLLFITMIWGGAFVVVKNTTDTVPPGYLNAFRFGIAAVCMAVFFFKRLKYITVSYIKAGFLIGFFDFAAYELQTYGLKYTTVGNSSFLTAIYCVVVPFLYWAIRRKKPGFLNLIAAVICLMGVGFLTLHGSFEMNPGDILTILCGISFAAQIVAVSILTEKDDPILLTLIQMAATVVFSLPTAVFTEKMPTSFDWPAIASLLFLGIFSTMVAFVLQNICQKYVPAAKASLIMSLESVFGTLSGILFLNESFSIYTFLGFVMIFASILLAEYAPALSNWKKSRKAADGLDENPKNKAV